MKKLIKFSYLGAEHKIAITPESSDWWTSVDDFDIHYCEDYNEVCVYLEGTYECIHKESIKATDPMRKMVRNYDADYFVNEDGEVCDNGSIKRYAVEIQNEWGDVIEYRSAHSEEEAELLIEQFNNTANL